MMKNIPPKNPNFVLDQKLIEKGMKSNKKIKLNLAIFVLY
jgi:hypothetical protein